jgi:dTDP-4-dehydrorhamnose reductase
MRARILVLGAGGQLGRHVIEALTGLRVIALAHAQCDIADERQFLRCFAANRPTIVINCAAFTRVDDAEADKAGASRVNTIGPGLLAALCAHNGTPLLHFSTDSVFGGIPPADIRRGYTPADVAGPLNHYGATKLQGEDAIRRALREHWIVRTSWLFSRHGSNFVRSILYQAERGDALRVVDDQIGNPTWAGHLAAATRAIVDGIDNGSAPAFGVHHFAGTPAISRHGFAAAIVEDAHAYGWIQKRPAVIPVTTAEFPRPAVRAPDARLHADALISQLRLPAPAWRDGLAAMSKEMVPA